MMSASVHDNTFLLLNVSYSSCERNHSHKSFNGKYTLEEFLREFGNNSFHNVIISLSFLPLDFFKKSRKTLKYT